MAALDEKKTVCLYFDCKDLTDVLVPDEYTFVLPVVSTPTTLKPQTLRPFGSYTFDLGTSFVSVGSLVYCIGGEVCEECERYSNEVRVFDINQPQLEFLPSFTPPMKEGRFFPAVTAIGKIIYVFGGLDDERDDAIDSVWAECLDTAKPRHQQCWVALKNPPNRMGHFDSSPFAVPCDRRIGGSHITRPGNAILTGGEAIGKYGAFLYIVDTDSWIKYKFKGFTGLISNAIFNPSFDPVSVVHKNTMYWFDGDDLLAYDLKKHILYYEKPEDPLLDKIDFNEHYTPLGPVLMHLENNMFYCFTMHGENPAGARKLKCTKFKVTDVGVEVSTDGKSVGYMQSQVMSSQSYKFDRPGRLFGAVYSEGAKSKECEDNPACDVDNSVKKQKKRRRKEFNADELVKKRRKRHKKKLSADGSMYKRKKQHKKGLNADVTLKKHKKQKKGTKQKSRGVDMEKI